jgi:hypothetical protein
VISVLGPGTRGHISIPDTDTGFRISGCRDVHIKKWPRCRDGGFAIESVLAKRSDSGATSKFR